MKISSHEIALDAVEVESATNEDGSLHIATITPARDAAVTEVLRADIHDMDGRSNWVWVRLVDGTLVLGMFPQGDTYINMADGERV